MIDNGEDGGEQGGEADFSAADTGIVDFATSFSERRRCFDLAFNSSISSFSMQWYCKGQQGSHGPVPLCPHCLFGAWSLGANKHRLCMKVMYTWPVLELLRGAIDDITMRGCTAASKLPETHANKCFIKEGC
ncbi:uncharacterized protein LOC116030943 isoform X3 [Ipomoea triloba]|uniref:uncharacterized protein LOC116030943 isoform X3 n=1 Tax=Ipomoea triloba TaxID=35885 RepID=UPI00125DE8AD|nr:uncharacterized protein LOC116030943 isoform X3 [Ipomoea triloba]